MATKKQASTKKATASRASTTRRSPSTAARRRTTRRRTTRSTGTYRRRTRPGLPTTIGSAIGMLIVTTLLEASWPVRVGLVLVVLLLGLVYLLWAHRAETAASAQAERAHAGPPADGTPEAATTTTAPDPAATDPTPTQGDSPHE